MMISIPRCREHPSIHMGIEKIVSLRLNIGSYDLIMVINLKESSDIESVEMEALRNKGFNKEYVVFMTVLIDTC